MERTQTFVATLSLIVGGVGALVAGCSPAAQPTATPQATATTQPAPTATIPAPTATPTPGPQYELWAIDQSDADKGGAKLYIYASKDLEQKQAGTPEVVDLTVAAGGVGAGVGVRPHALSFNGTQTHALIAHVASGHVYVMRTKDRKVVASIDVGEQAHWAAVSPDDKSILVANQNGKKLARITADFAAEKFTHDPAQDLNLAALEDKDYPDNAPICPLIFAPGTQNTYVTLRGGGLLVVDAGSTPMKVVQSLPKDIVSPAGCGGVATGGKVYIDSGTATSGHVYVFKPEGLAKTLVMTEYGTDTHGMMLVGKGRYLWVGNRGLGDNIVVIDTQTDTVAGMITAVRPAPDIMGISPTGDIVYVAVRGPNPATGGAPARGERPGVHALKVTQNGASGEDWLFIPIGDQGATSTSDVHGVAVRVVK